MINTTSSPRNTIMHGDCLKVLPQLAARSVDFILTDPPYIVSYRSRDNQTLRKSSATVKWWSKAVNCIPFLSFAALRTPANPWDTRASLCVECVLD